MHRCIWLFAQEMQFSCVLLVTGQLCVVGYSSVLWYKVQDSYVFYWLQFSCVVLGTGQDIALSDCSTGRCELV